MHSFTNQFFGESLHSYGHRFLHLANFLQMHPLSLFLLFGARTRVMSSVEAMKGQYTVYCIQYTVGTQEE